MEFALALAIVLETLFSSNAAVMAAVAKLKATGAPPQEPPVEDPDNPPEPPDYEEPPAEEPPPPPPAEEPPPPPPPVTAAFDTSKKPSAYIDTVNASWKLNTDRQLNGDKTGYSPTVYSKKGTPMLEDFSSDQFKVVPEGILMAADVDGITTSSGTKYARTELRGTWPKSSERDTPYNKQFLPNTGETSLVSEFFVKQFAKREGSNLDGRVVIGQVHGPDDELCRFYVDKCRDQQVYRPDGSKVTADTDFYYVNDKSTFNGSTTSEKIIGLYDSAGKGAKYEGGKILRTIEIKGGVMIVTAVYKGVTYRAIEPLSSFWKGTSAWCYWKDGVYLAQHNLDTTEGQRGYGRGEVVFQSITLSYGPTLQTQKS